MSFVSSTLMKCPYLTAECRDPTIRVRKEKIGVIVLYRGKEWELKGGMTARNAVLKLGLDPEAVLVILNGKLVEDSAILEDGDSVRVVAVVSGG